ncbi:hypothetical protein [Microbacterium sp. YJN-G]|uniref:hypothetical protein n=1 Tax=Microbacterium sp. YJN-G TaxID=2763257 RepID=UPI0018778C89|nr:hypothetical protein [Microbacterium sp. YJN-G]
MATTNCPICDGIDVHDGLVHALTPNQLTPAASGEPVRGWVAVKFQHRPAPFDIEVMTRLMQFEFDTATAVTAAGVGWADGNEIGAHSYDLFWDGPDVDALWGTIEPLLRLAPAAWTTAEIHRATARIEQGS